MAHSAQFYFIIARKSLTFTGTAVLCSDIKRWSNNKKYILTVPSCKSIIIKLQAINIKECTGSWPSNPIDWSLGDVHVATFFSTFPNVLSY